MDRRLPIRPDTYVAQLARRELVLEQRLDQLARFRPQSQRYFNPPCCAATLAPLTVTVEPATVFGGATAIYTFLAPATSATIEASGDVPSDDGRGFGVQIEVTHNSASIATLELTGAGATTGVDALVESFVAADELMFDVTSASIGTIDNLTVVMTFDGDVVESIAWQLPS